MSIKSLSIASVLAAMTIIPVAWAADAPGGATEHKGVGWMQESERDDALHLTPNKAHGREVYEVCSACHMPNGWGLEDGTFPQLAGQHRTVIVKQLSDIRAGNRDNPTMYPFALPSEIGGTQSIADVADYIAGLKMAPENGIGPGSDLEHGKKLYADNCVRCHGETGEGNNEKFFPRIQGQHYAYLMRQYKWIKEGKRRNANPDMVKQIQGFSDKDTSAVLDYVSRLKPPADLTAPKGWENPDFK
jgi:cytochrome c553